ncbi:glycosyltransferase [Vibrio cholerae]|uniref:glycosyltransferase family 2 protein n=1 Tax=Vibrio cholerae TaxID=666 RepID=UPI0035311E48
MEKVIFSIVIPLYNKESYVLRTLQSILEQKFNFFEIIVVDDGSTDNSLAIVNDIIDKRLSVFSQKNAGVSEARNKGIELANGEYICFLDADDEMHSDYLSKLYAYIESSGFKNFYFSNYLIERNGKNAPAIRNIPAGIFENYLEMMLDNVSPVFTGSVCIKKDIMKDVRFPKDIRFGEDLFVWFKLYSRCDFYYTGIISTTYKADVNGSLSNIRFDGVTPEIFFIEESHAELMKISKFKKLDKYLSHRYYKFGKINAYNGNWKYCKDVFFKLIRRREYLHSILLVIYGIVPNRIISLKRKLT